MNNNTNVLRTLVRAGNVTGLSEALDLSLLTNVSKDTKIHYSTLSKYKNDPGTIKTDIYIVLAEYYGLSPQELLTLALNDMGYKPKK